MTKDPYIKEEDGAEQGTFDADVYTEEGREKLVEEGVIDDVEEGFTEGYEHGEHQVTCQNCKQILTDENFVEEEFNNVKYRFCNDTCVEQYHKKHKVI